MITDSESFAANDIESRIESIRQKYGLDVPVNLTWIAKSEGISVFCARFPRPEIAGLIRKGKHETLILVRGTRNPASKRIVLAHELGHYFLHLSKDENGNFIDGHEVFRFGGRKSNRLEEEAHAFAVSLLMPEDEVRYLRSVGATIADMAEIFGVPGAWVFGRLQSLGLLRGNA